MLELKSIHAGYGSFQALFDVSLEVREGEAVGVIGPNGAGKTTLMRVVSGLIRPTSGSIVMDGIDLAATPPHRIVELGVAHVPESAREPAPLRAHERRGQPQDGRVRAGGAVEVPPAARRRL
jgi:branched-chain amino acid transport system ATP-binding protein